MPRTGYSLERLIPESALSWPLYEIQGKQKNILGQRLFLESPKTRNNEAFKMLHDVKTTNPPKGCLQTGCQR